MRPTRFSEWQDRLEAIVREKLGDDVHYDVEVARNAWREALSPRAFFHDYFVDDCTDPEAVDDLGFDVSDI